MKRRYLACVGLCLVILLTGCDGRQPETTTSYTYQTNPATGATTYTSTTAVDPWQRNTAVCVGFLNIGSCNQSQTVIFKPAGLPETTAGGMTFPDLVMGLVLICGCFIVVFVAASFGLGHTEGG